VRVAVLGLGSIGRRHCAIVRALGHEVIGYDICADAPQVDGVRRACSEADALAGVSAVIVASPPSEHLRQARLALDSGLHALVEKPFAPSADGVTELGALAQERGLVLRVAMNLRFHPGVLTVRRLLAAGAIGRPLRASVWFGSWLPGWRAKTDYRQSYSARRELGGGVLLDSIHELDYAIWLLGPVIRVQAQLAHESSLELDVEDLAALVLEHASGVVTSMTLDYLDRAYNRGCRVVGEEGTIQWSWERQAVVLHRAQGEAERVATPSEVAPTYRAEVAAFLDAAARGEPANAMDARAASADEAAAALAVVDAARLACTRATAAAVRTAGSAAREMNLARAETDRIEVLR